MIEAILMSLLEPVSKLGVDGKTSFLVVVITAGAVHFIKQHKSTQKEINQIKEILDEKLRTCEEQLKECRHDKKVATQLHKEVEKRCENLEQKLSIFISNNSNK